MIAARICGYPAIGLANLLSEYFEVKVDKRHQHDNWGARPLSDESLRYAQKDSHYLPALRDHLNRDLKRNGHLTEAHEIFEDATYVKDANHRAFDPDGFWRIGTPHSLTRQQMAILRELYLLRDRIARRRDLPVFKIFSSRVLVSVAEASPRSLKDLRSIRGMSPVQIRRYGKRILQAVERGRASPLPDPPRHQPPDPVVTERYAALHTWRKERAQQRGVESDVIVSKDTLWTLAHRVPTSLDEMQSIRGLGPWRMETYGPELLDVLMGAISE
jgi:ribonuclease D